MDSDAAGSMRLLPIKLEFTITSADSSEAKFAFNFIERGLKGFIWLFTIILLGCIGFIVWMSHGFAGLPHQPAAPTTMPAPDLKTYLKTYPQVLIPLLFWVLILFTRRKLKKAAAARTLLYATQVDAERAKARLPRARRMQFAIYIGSGIVLVVIALLRWGTPTETSTLPADTSPPAASSNSIIPLIPWLLIFGVIWFINLLRIRRKWTLLSPGSGVTVQSEKQIVLDIGEEGTTVTSEGTVTRRTWGGYLRVRETVNLFLLYKSPEGVEIIPKHAFRSSEETSGFREFLRRKIGEPPVPGNTVNGPPTRPVSETTMLY